MRRNKLVVTGASAGIGRATVRGLAVEQLGGDPDAVKRAAAAPGDLGR